MQSLHVTILPSGITLRYYIIIGRKIQTEGYVIRLSCTLASQGEGLEEGSLCALAWEAPLDATMAFQESWRPFREGQGRNPIRVRRRPLQGLEARPLRVSAQPLLGLPGSLAALFAFGFPSAQLSHGLSVIVHTTPSKRLLPPARSEKTSTYEAFSALS